MRATICCWAVIAAIGVSSIDSRASNVTLGPIQDADVATGGDWDDFPAGLSTHISANYENATSVVAHIEFDTSSFAPGTVQDATLRLFHDFNFNNGVSFDIYRVTSPWNEVSVTYPTRPTLDAAVYSTLAIADSNNKVWREWDVTSLVQEWVNGTSTNYGLAILRDPDASPWPYFRAKDFNGSDGFPELIVTLVPEPTSLALLGMAVACWTFHGTARRRFR
jgi:hypothetical protein